MEPVSGYTPAQYTPGSLAVSTVPTRKRKKAQPLVLTACVNSKTRSPSSLLLQSLPVALQKCLIPFLNYSAQGVFSQVCRDWHQYAGNSPIYAKIMGNFKNFQQTRQRTTIAQLTLAGQVNALIHRGSGSAMFHMADALSRGPNLVEPVRRYITDLLIYSIATKSRKERTQCLKVQARMALLGCPIINPFNEIHTHRLLHFQALADCQRAHLTPEEKTHGCLVACSFGIWGYLNAENMAKGRALLHELRDATKDPSLALRQVTALVDDFLEYLMTADTITRQQSFTKLKNHVRIAACSDWYHHKDFFTFTPLIALARLKIIECDLDSTGQSPETMKQLCQLCDDMSIIPLIRALAEATLAYQKLIHPKVAVTDEEVCQRLRRFDSSILRIEVQALSAVLLALFHLQKRIIDSNYLDSRTRDAVQTITAEAELNRTLSTLNFQVIHTYLNPSNT